MALRKSRKARPAIMRSGPLGAGGLIQPGILWCGADEAVQGARVVAAGVHNRLRPWREIRGACLSGSVLIWAAGLCLLIPDIATARAGKRAGRAGRTSCGAPLVHGWRWLPTLVEDGSCHGCDGLRQETGAFHNGLAVEAGMRLLIPCSAAVALLGARRSAGTAGGGEGHRARKLEWMKVRE